MRLIGDSQRGASPLRVRAATQYAWESARDCVAASARDRPETEGPALSENAVSPLEVSLTRPNNSRA